MSALRAVFGTFPTGVVAVCVRHTSTTWPVLAKRPRLGVSVLAPNRRS